MDKVRLQSLLERVQKSETSIEEALSEFKKMPFEDLGFAKVDHHRSLRNGYPEVIFGQGKTDLQIKQIVLKMLENCDHNIMITRVGSETFACLKEDYPEAVFFEMARIIVINQRQERLHEGTIAVISAGTSDMPVAEEAAITAEILGNNVVRIYDVGVAGIHRLFAHSQEIMQASVVVVVAGMEGALASVVGGLVDKPVIAVPTSVGYGASFGGLAALLTMLNSCASGIGVVNIDNGFGAGYLASMINKT